MRALSLRLGCALVLLSGLLGLDLGAGTAAAAPPARAGAKPYVLKRGETQPVYSYTNAIRQSVWVKAPDGDGDGNKDLVTADIIRPSELDGVAKVPVIMDASPYYLCCGRGQRERDQDVRRATGTRSSSRCSTTTTSCRAATRSSQVDMAGTARSSGCADEGAASDINSVKAVIDWLNGRATAVDVEGNPVTAYWANGKVGMIGKSYDGTLANGVAATGVKGLVTIVPISAISSWYDYDRSQGLPFSYNYPTFLSQYVEGSRTRTAINCSAINSKMAAGRRRRHRRVHASSGRRGTTGRRRRRRPSKVKASVFLVHGLQDTNVKTVNFGRWYELLQQNARRHEGLAVPAGPHRPVRLPAEALGGHAASLVRQPADGHRQRHPRRAADRRGERARHVGHVGRVAGVGQRRGR